jgi:hypothetical protein
MLRTDKYTEQKQVKIDENINTDRRVHCILQ